MLLVQNELLIFAAIRVEAPIVKKFAAQTIAGRCGKESCRYYLIRVDVVVRKNNGFGFQRFNWLHLFKPSQVGAGISHATFNSRGSCGHRARKDGARADSLAAFKITIAGTDAEFAGRYRVAVHSEAHRTA